MNNGADRIAHAAGLFNLMHRRGPPDLNDELDVHLAFSSQAPLVKDLADPRHPSRNANAGWQITYSMNQGAENFQRSEPWDRALRAAIETCPFLNAEARSNYRLSLTMIRWPLLIQRGQKLRLAPDRPRDAATLRAARALLHDAAAVAVELAAYDATRLATLRRQGRIAEVPCAHGVGGAAMAFAGLDLARNYALHALASLAVGQVLARVRAFLGVRGPPPPCDVDDGRAWSRRIWMTYPYAARFRPLGCRFMLSPLVLSFAAGDAAERAYVRAALRDLDPYRDELTSWVDDWAGGQTSAKEGSAAGP